MLDTTKVAPYLPGSFPLSRSILNKKENQQLKQNVVTEQLSNRAEIISQTHEI